MADRAFRYWRLPGKSAERTRALVAHLARVYGGHPRMRFWVVRNVLEPAGVPARDVSGAVRAVHNWVRDHIRFVNEPGEQVLTPARTLLWRLGDCDDRSGLVAAMLESLRIGWRLVLLARRLADGRRVPFHIWPQARLGARWVNLETSHADARFDEHPAQLMRRVIVQL